MGLTSSEHSPPQPYRPQVAAQPYQTLTQEQLHQLYSGGVSSNVVFRPQNYTPAVPRRSIPLSGVPVNPPPLSVLHTKQIRNFITVKKGTIKLNIVSSNPNIYIVQFDIDAQLAGVVDIYFYCREVIDSDGKPSFEEHISRTHTSTRFATGLGQHFFQDKTEGISLDDQDVGKEDLNSDIFPLVIVLHLDSVSAYGAADKSPNNAIVDSQITYCSLYQENSRWQVKVLKQKLIIGKQSYTLAEVFGLDTRELRDDLSDSSPCVVCLTDQRSVTVFPCRHCCVCVTCANILRVQRDIRCPICRTHITDLVNIMRS